MACQKYGFIGIEGQVKIVRRVKRGVNRKIPLSFAVTASVIMQTFYQIAFNVGL